MSNKYGTVKGLHLINIRDIKKFKKLYQNNKI